MPSGLLHFIRARREPIEGDKQRVRMVYRSEFVRDGTPYKLDQYISDKVPLFYRSISAIIAELSAGYFITAIKNTLAKLPTSQSFQESHFGEIVAAIFAEEVMGLHRLYSKLTLLTAENANAYKMDLVLYDPSTEPVRIVFGEVKSSPKSASDGLPAKHDESCFADIFNSLNQYSDADRRFDLTAANDNIVNIPEEHRERVRAALKPYSAIPIGYAAFAVIDSSTYSNDEVQVLRTRKNKKEFEIDVVCLEVFSFVAGKVYSSLQKHLAIGQENS